MSISAASLAATAISDQTRVNATGSVPRSRILIPKPDTTLIPEPR